MEFDVDESKRWSGDGALGIYNNKSSRVKIDQNNLVEELDEIFHDANDYFPSSSMAIANPPMINR